MEAKDYVELFVAALCEGDESQARTVMEQAQNNGLTGDQLYLDVFAPSMVRIGELWERNELSVAEEHLATAITERLIGELSPLFRQENPRNRRILLGCVQGENHTLGLRMLNDMLLQRGWRVLFLGANVPTEEWPRIIARTRADAVGISANASRFLPELRRVVGIIHHHTPQVRVLIGGAAIDRDPEFAHMIRADVYDRDPHIALATLDTLVEGTGN